MKIQISDNIIKYYLRNVYFINGHSYAGKSTMVKMLAEQYDMLCYAAVRIITMYFRVRNCHDGSSPDYHILML